MHYFERRLDVLLSELAELPKRVLVNRSPFTRGEDLVTVQDNGTYFVPCVAWGRESFLAGMLSLGYELRGQWPIHERRLRAPLYPDLLEPHYSGFYFERP
jgi:putative methyltransferase (TIGR04325 family)